MVLKMFMSVKFIRGIKSRKRMWIRHDHPDDGGSTHPESSVRSSETTRRYIPEESKPQENITFC
jgi:hypothetical protein